MKEIIIRNNVIEIYKNLKNDKEKSQFLLKIFKFLVENDENFEVKKEINYAFLGVKPSLKLKEKNENWGGYRDNSGRKINKTNNQVEIKLKSSCNQVDNQLENDNLNQVPYKYISNKDNNIQNQNENQFDNQNDIFITYEYCEKLYNDMKFTFDLTKFWLHYKERALFKKDCSVKMYDWQKRQDDWKEKELKEQKEQEIKQEQDLKNSDIKLEYDMTTNTFIKYRLVVKDGKVVKQIIKE